MAQEPEPTVTVTQFKNEYRCEPCGEEWDDIWCCACNDKCPRCNAEIEPFDSHAMETFKLRLKKDDCPVCGSPHDF